ncbi:MAG: hypothetical protein J5I93_24355, partial [Pirellulaceae bacterium]|nr:hypothetical protein [Pirellulaceae bacterium]
MKLPAARQLEELASAISRRWGLDPRLAGEQSLLGALRRQMQQAGAADGDAYVAELLEDAERVERLVDELLVPETWFFRDRQPFHCLRQYALERLRSNPADRLRVLSIPCSTGEEPFSIAMALLDAGLSAIQFRVDAADVSQRHLSLASQAIFGKASFRGDEREFPGVCERYLELRGASYTVSAEVRRTVEFFRANLVAPLMLSERPRYHVIFCRNVLIYLTPAARQAALQNLHRWLLAGGLLYCGHVEARLVRSGPFVPFAREFPFAFAPVVGPRAQ